MSGWTDTYNASKGIVAPAASGANSNYGSVTPESYFTGDNRLVYTQYGPMSQRYALKSMYNDVAPAAGYNYVPYDQYNDVLSKYDPSGLGFNWTGSAKSAPQYVSNYYAANGMQAPAWGQNALAAGVNYGSGVNTAGIQQTMPSTPVDWGSIANQTSYNPTNSATGPYYTPVAATPPVAPVGSVGAGAVDARGNIRGGSTPAATTPPAQVYSPPPAPSTTNARSAYQVPSSIYDTVGQYDPRYDVPVPGAIDARGNYQNWANTNQSNDRAGYQVPAGSVLPPDPNRYNPPPRDYNANPLTPEEISALNAPMGSSRVTARSQYQVPAVTARNASTTPTAGPPASYNLPTGYTFVRPGKAGGSWQIVKDSQGNEFIYDPSTGSLEPNDYAHTMGSSGGTTPPGGYDQFGVSTPGGQYDFMGTQLKPGDVGYVATPSTNDRSLWTRPGASSTASVARSDTTPFDPTAIQSGPNLFGNASEIDPAILAARAALQNGGSGAGGGGNGGSGDVNQQLLDWIIQQIMAGGGGNGQSGLQGGGDTTSMTGWENSPWYQWQQQQGQQALDRRFSAMGRMNSTPYMNAMANFTNQLNSNEAQLQYGRMMDLAKMGQTNDLAMAQMMYGTGNNAANYYNQYGTGLSDLAQGYGNWGAQSNLQYGQDMNSLQGTYANALMTALVNYANAGSQNAWQAANPLASLSQLQGQNTGNMYNALGQIPNDFMQQYQLYKALGLI